ncbi:MAG: helix-turn-helix domain-containing protein [Roseburia sp.]|nr:helix-turn-helix domain-containing protein [Roseburia sp.]
MTFGESLKQHRKGRNLTQEQLAEKFQVTRQTVSKWELDQAMPEVGKMVEIAEYFEISLDEILLGQNPSKEMEILEELKPVEEEKPKQKKNAGFVIYFVGIAFFTIIFFPVLDKSTGRWDWRFPNILDVCFCYILLAALVFGLLIRQVGRDRESYKRWAAVAAIATGFLFSLYYTEGVIKANQLAENWRIGILPMYYGIVIASVFGIRKS